MFKLLFFSLLDLCLMPFEFIRDLFTLAGQLTDRDESYMVSRLMALTEKIELAILLGESNER